MSKLLIDRDVTGRVRFSMTEMTGTKQEQEDEFVKFFLDVNEMIEDIRYAPDNLEVTKNVTEKIITKN